PLYRALFDRFRGGLLPGDVGLNAAIKELGVAPKQVQTARQVFMRSAEQAGFFRLGRERLVEPSGGAPIVKEEEPPSAKERGDVDHLTTHPIIQGLFMELPEPEKGFPAEDRETWLTAARISFDLIYGRVQSIKAQDDGEEED